MTNKKLGLNTICTHVGGVTDEQFKGAVSPIYMSTVYAFQDTDIMRYPRAFNTPNQSHLAKKIAMLEQAEAAMLFSSGMAAVSSTFLTFLKAGDHVVVQQPLYGGTHHFVKETLSNYGIEFTFTQNSDIDSFEQVIKPNTKLIHIETPSNPLMTITDIAAVAALGKDKGVITTIDNTFATPINQNPLDFGIDIVIHSATKYMGGHSDIQAGAVAASQEHINAIWHVAKDLGGNLNDFTVWLLERSMKTMGLRVKAQNRNAKKLAKYLYEHDDVKAVYYPGLKSHPQYNLAKAQLKGFGGMLSFELVDGLNAELFLKSLKLIKPAMSLAGVESTMLLPSQTSHALLTASERQAIGVTDQLIRFSVGIESKTDLMTDIEQALLQIK
ncbi:trans-sulfuration enzyme family protein [Mangrovimonas aestuarii]|uniref:trans-sulfuration enzyme family protein n=1 Tax=Mangrovimonas aestuarii TaxID=3018443 RepID=UPI002379430B|nr:aminotransferase class I/II-fold pyridoxal phosphate-dependent enzyme [Mangrovimonas aestuarii]